MLAHNYSGVDLGIFGASLVISICIGIFQAVRSSRQAKGATTRDFLVGNRNMPVIPTALSVLTSFLSGVLMLGVPAEIYLQGALMWIYMLSGVVALAVAAVFFLPVIYELKPTSVYEYFEYRFQSKAVRLLGSGLFLFGTLVYMSIAIYAPAVALNGVTKVPTWVFIGMMHD